MIRPLGIFDHVYVINLPHRTDRRRRVEAELRASGLALDGPGVSLFPAVRPDCPGPFATTGARGCFLSPLEVLTESTRKGDTSLLIPEDDIQFVGDFMLRWPEIARSLDRREWSFFYGGYELSDPRLKPAGGIQQIPPTMNVRLTHFLALRGPAIAEGVTYLERMLERPAGDRQGGPMHIEGPYSWLRAANPELETFVAAPALGFQRPSCTDVHALHWYDRWPGVRGIAEALRRVSAGSRRRRFLETACP